MTLEEASKYCRRLATRHYENFTVASFLIPRRFRQDFFNIYAFCRWSDDLADEIPEPELSLQLLDWWEHEFLQSLNGSASHPVLIALSETIRRRHLKSESFTDLLIAFRRDQREFRYQSSEALLSYCRYSANPVGRILLNLAGCLSPKTVNLSDSICTGLQLANFCQDMSRDAAIGRIYAPHDLLERHHVSETMILAAEATPELQSLLRDWVFATREYFKRGTPLVGMVPKWLATDIDLFIGCGMAILDEIERADFDVWTSRPTVSKTRKLGILLNSAARRLWPQGQGGISEAAVHLGDSNGNRGGHG